LDRSDPPLDDAELSPHLLVSTLRTRLAKVRKYLTKSTQPHMRSEWESRIGKYEVLLVKAEARARLTA